MRVTRNIAILLMGISLIPGACAPVRQTPAPSVPPVPPVPTPVPTPTPKSTVFITSDLTIEPPAFRLGDGSMIGVTVTNTGEQPGTYPVVLRLNGFIAETRDVTLAGGASQRVTFFFNTYSEREYVVTIDQLNGRLEARADVVGGAN